MVHFGETLRLRTNPDFAGYYIEYDDLKARIHELVALCEEGCDAEGYVAVLHNKAELFSQILDRAATFYEEKLEENTLPQICTSNVKESVALLSDDQLKDTARGIRECVTFVELNAEAVRKILKKAEKHVLGSVSAKGRRPSHLPSQVIKAISRDTFIRTRLRPDHKMASRLEALRVYRGVDSVVEEIRRRCDALRSLEAQWHQMGLVDTDYVHRVHQRRDTLELLTGLHSAVQSTVKTTKWYYGSVAQAKIDYEMEPIGDANTWGLLLNNYNTFLYIANCYAVIPTANQYAAAVGLSRMVSGLLLAMTSLSAMLASILYSVWSNKSFKQPLMFSTLLLVAGNALYGMALDYQSALMLFAGRLLVGLGGNRAVNRRYIADFVRIEDRTFHSALFVTVSSLGMALGPGCQHFFNMLNFKLPFFGYTVNPLTSSSWIAALLWLLFALKILVLFTEPVRRVAVEPTLNEHGLLQPLLATADHRTGFATDPLTSSASTVGISHLLGPSPHSVRLMIPSVPLETRETVTGEVDLNGTVVCLWLYFVLKLVQEAFQTAAPMYTAYEFSWEDDGVGYFLAVIGVVALPVNLFLGSVGQLVSDRTLNFVSLILLGIGAALTTSWVTTMSISVNQFVSGALLLVVAAQCLESASMSLLSKVMPKVMSRGLWNSGFLSTEAGACGRVVGASLITLVGSVSELMGNLSVPEMQVLVLSPCVALVALSLGFVWWNWTSLSPIAERMSKNIANDADAILESDTWKRLPELRPLCTLTRVQHGGFRVGVQIHALSSNAIVHRPGLSIRQLTSSFFTREGASKTSIADGMHPPTTEGVVSPAH